MKKKGKFLKQVMSLVLCLVLALGMIPLYAEEINAEEDGTTTEGKCVEADCEGTYENGFCSLVDTHYEVATKTTDKYNIDDTDGYEEVYEISNAGQLYWFAAQVNAGNMGYNAVLTTDIVINPGTFSSGGYYNPKDGEEKRSWTPIGTANKRYGGVFDGQGHMISGLYVNVNSNNVGLFGGLDSSGSVKNVTIENAYLQGKGYVGSVIGYNAGGKISNCTNKGTIKGSGQYVGGIVGQNTGVISNCSNAGVVESTNSYVGGIAGNNVSNGTISHCNNTSSIQGKTHVGGIAGSNQATISYSYNKGSIEGTGSEGSYYDYACNVGGIAGYLSGSVQYCYNTGTVYSSYNNVGGIVGRQYEGTVQACYNMGSVRSNDDNVGVIGKKESGTVSNCYYLDGVVNGGIQGKDVAGQAESKTTDQFASGEVTYLLNGAASDTVYWYQNIDTGNVDDYPVLDDSHGVVYYGFDKCLEKYSNTKDGLSDSGETHELKYEVSGDAILASCGYCATSFGKVSLSKPTNLVYTGSEIEAVVENTLTTGDEVKVVYSGENLVDGKPVYVGTYVASIEIAGKSITVEYTIAAQEIENVTLDVTAPVAGEVPQDSVTAGEHYTAEISWDTTNEKFDFNTKYTATVTLTPMDNYAFSSDLSVEGWTVEVTDGVAVLTKTFEATRKAKLLEIKDEPVEKSLGKYYADVTEAVKELPSSITYVTEDTEITVEIEWSCENYNPTVSVENTFTWNVKEGELTDYDTNEIKTTGSIRVTNAAPILITNVGKDTEVAYSGSTIDLSRLFTLDTNAGEATYTVVPGTGEGELVGATGYSVTKAGTFTVEVTTAAHDAYAAGTATAVLTVNKGNGTATVSLAGWAYGENANAPVVVSSTNGIAHVTYQYKVKDAEDSTYTDIVPTLAGDYTVKAVFAATGLYTEVTATYDFTIVKAIPNIGTVTVNTLNNTTDVSEIELSRENTDVAGALSVVEGQTLTWGENEIAYTFTPSDTDNYEIITGKVTVTVTDTTAPTAKYQIGTDGWREFVNTITFGLFCKDYTIIEIQAADNLSGVQKVQYYVADEAMDAAALENVTWQTYDADNKISLNATGKYIIYVLVTDNAGNTTVKGISTKGIVIYGKSTVTSRVSRVYKSGEYLDIAYTGNGNTPASITCADKTLEGTDYSTAVNPNGTAIVISPEWLDTLDAGEYTITVTFNPQGVETDDSTVTETLTETITLIVEPAELTITGVSAENRKFDGTDKVAITGITLGSVKDGDNVGATFDDLTGTLSSANAGTYDTVTLGDLITLVTLTGEDAANYKLVFTNGTSIPTDVTISKADPAIGTVTANVLQDSYDVADVVLVRENTSVAGTLTADADQILELGENEISYTFTPADTTNYEVITGTVTVIVKESGKITTEVEVKDDVPETKVENLTPEVVEDLLTEEQIEEVKDGTDISVYLEVTNINGDVPATDATFIEETINTIIETLVKSLNLVSKDEVDTGMHYIDLSLYMKLGDVITKLDDTKGNGLKVTIAIPEDMKSDNAGRSYYIIRVHNNSEVEVLDTVYDVEKDTLTFTTDKFSTYAICYTDTTNAKVITEKPETGDSSNAVLWVMLMVAGCGMIIIGQKRRVR